MARGEFLVTAIEAAEHLGISFNRFKVAIMRGLGLDPKRRPNGNEARPVVGGWSARSAKYRASEIKRMHEKFPFRSNRTPDHGWFRLVSAGLTRPAKVPTPLRSLTASNVPVIASRATVSTRTPKPRTERSQAIPKPNIVFDWLL